MADAAYSLRELQLVELEILRVIDAFCKENQIEYFLDSGTALGAKRHGGFIPWDDDIDVGMLRGDYDRFLELAEGGLPKGYSLHAFDNTHGFACFFAKVYKDGTTYATAETLAAGCNQSIFVDVFPYDVLSSDEAELQKQLQGTRKWRIISFLYHSKVVISPWKSSMGQRLFRLLSCLAHHALRTVLKRSAIQDGFIKSLNFSAAPSNKVASFAAANPGAYLIDELYPPKPYDFEGEEYPCPRELEQYLIKLYGKTWNLLPPDEDRKTHEPVEIDYGRSQ